jgi:hypothetical protein
MHLQKNDAIASIVVIFVLIASVPGSIGHCFEPPTAAELVQGIVDLENKVHKYDRIRISVSGTWTRTPRAIAAHRAEILGQLGTKEIPDNRKTELRPTWTESEELIFDAKRVRTSHASSDGRSNLCVWNGALAKSCEQYIPFQQNRAAISGKPQFFASLGESVGGFC